MCQLIEVIYSCGHSTKRFCDRGFAPDGPCKHAPNFGATPVRIPHSCPAGLRIEDVVHEEHLCPMNDHLMSCTERYELSAAQNGVYLICRDRLEELWLHCGATIGPRLQCVLKGNIQRGLEAEQYLHSAARRAMTPVVRAVLRYPEFREKLMALEGEWAMMIAELEAELNGNIYYDVLEMEEEGRRRKGTRATARGE
ncbi:hypothetical protein BDV96DRAFT_598512 [Lophiotrema nucula]|uniref:Uncharacterized protein n=1 Tax=Lophiotrema nucula TaxID=690887 RepID=A0A6A5ZDV6_9PLEO|nr:hypothetical protein BDV96DRAFT_598512 [Lophiotrema nucula]